MNLYLACLLALFTWSVLRWAVAVTIVRPLTVRAFRRMMAKRPPGLHPEWEAPPNCPCSDCKRERGEL